MKTLVVSGDAALRELVARAAREAGFAALESDNADDALQVYERENPVLLLVDWGRSKAGGPALCRRIRGSVGGDCTLIVALTETDEPEQLRAVLDAGADDYVAPPFTSPALALRLAAARAQAEHRTTCPHSEDITDRKQVELELLASERRYRQLFEHSPISIWEEDFSEVKAHIDLLRKKGVADFRQYFSDHPEEAVACAFKVRVVEVNAASLELYGASSDEQLRAGLPNLFTDDSYRAFLKQLEAIGEGRTFLKAESLTCSLTGEDRNIAFIWSVAPGYESSYERVLISIVDLTELKRAERQARRFQAELARVARVNTLGEMAGALAHQLSQPLAAISGYAEGCVQRMQLGRPVHAELIDAVQRIASEALRAGKIIHGVRNLLCRGQLDYEVADLNALVSEASQLALVEADHEGFALHFDLAPQLPAVRVDRVQIQQVVLNLARNGFDAMRKGASQAGEVTISTSAPEPGMVQITVSDQGTGFPVQDMEEIFEPFFTTKADGLGMGLAVCRSIVEAHGGTLSAANPPGAGALVRVTLPADRGNEKVHG